MTEREINGSPWCWQSKEITRAIREAAGDAHTMKRDALAVYRALSELASDQQRETFPATHAMIFDQSGVSVTQIKRALSFLKGNHFVSWETPALRGPCSYTLLAYHVNTIVQGGLSLGPGGLALGQGQFEGKTATSEESEKNPKKNPDTTNPSSAKRTDVKMSSAESIYSEYPRKVGKSAALKAITAVLKSKDADFLIERTKAFSAATATWPAADHQFIPHPSTWFNQGRFDDDPTEWTRKPNANTLNRPNGRAYSQVDDYSGVH